MLWYTCSRGYIGINILLIENGGNNWNCGLDCICSGKNLEIVKLMIEKEPIISANQMIFNF